MSNSASPRTQRTYTLLVGVTGLAAAAAMLVKYLWTGNKPTRTARAFRIHTRHKSGPLVVGRASENLIPYEPPSWTKPCWAFGLPPLCVPLGHLPTPMVRVPFTQEDLRAFLPLSIADAVSKAQLSVYVKRDDLSGFELSGNKIRKLEFLLAEAVRNGHDCIVTVGGLQSNHCRSTACAARLLGLDTHLVLRVPDDYKDSVEEKQRHRLWCGNLLLDRLSGAHIHYVTKSEYQTHGSVALTEKLAENLRSEGRNPYVIPVGGSNWTGTWGYLNFVDELHAQTEDLNVPASDIVVSCGSGGTTAGIALGVYLLRKAVRSTLQRVHAFGVCDSPREFHRVLNEEVFPSGLLSEVSRSFGDDPLSSEDLVTIEDAKGNGYAVSTQEELQFIQKFAAHTGIYLDPVYSGKGMLGWLRSVAADSSRWSGRSVIFVHTGGLLGLYDKASELSSHPAAWAHHP